MTSHSLARVEAVVAVGCVRGELEMLCGDLDLLADGRAAFNGVKKSEPPAKDWGSLRTRVITAL